MAKAILNQFAGFSALFLIIPILMLSVRFASFATTQAHCYAHDAVHDKFGVIAPWYTGLNEQSDLRGRIAVETLPLDGQGEGDCC